MVLKREDVVGKELRYTDSYVKKQASPCVSIVIFPDVNAVISYMKYGRPLSTFQDVDYCDVTFKIECLREGIVILGVYSKGVKLGYSCYMDLKTLEQRLSEGRVEYIEKEKVEDHAGMVQGYDGEWKWF